MREEVVTWKLYLGLAFTIPTLECVTIGCYEVDGGCDGGGRGGEVFGGGVFGGSVVFSGDGEVDVVRRRSAMGEVSTLLSKNWYGVVKLESWSQRKRQFRQCDMTRNDDLVGVRVKEPISTMIVRVPKKDRWCGTRGKYFNGKLDEIEVLPISRNDLKNDVERVHTKFSRLERVVKHRLTESDVKYYYCSYEKMDMELDA
nr:hypothetical protein [Tanacetum cinerariifolium]